MQKAEKIQAEKLIGFKIPTLKNELTEKDAILYALGIGFSRDPLKQQDYKYTNQFHSDFITFPTVGVVMPRGNFVARLAQNPHMPKFNPHHVLHAEHKFTMIKPKIQIGVQYEHQIELVDIANKGKNAFIMSRYNSYVRNQKNQRQLCFYSEALSYFRGLGGFAFAGKGFIQPTVQIPKRKADFIFKAQTFSGQAFLYRLCADRNPLHIDPEIAKTQNFERPILHGLATYGTVARIFVQQILKNQSEKLKTIQTRFIGFVYPGETLNVHFWKNGNKYIYEAQVKQRGTKAVIGYIETREAPKI